MARILICEPHGDVRTLLEIVVKRLGHEPVVCKSVGEDESEVAAAVIEPGEGEGLPLARLLRSRGVPVIFTSIFPAEPETMALSPVAYLVKPFALYALENVLAQALEGPLRTAAAAV